MRKLYLYFIMALMFVLFIPGIITLIVMDKDAHMQDILDLPDNPPSYNGNDIYNKGGGITVINPDTMEKNEMSLESYICGVVAAEMPASFEMEALKAQAVAARTYAYRRIKDQMDVSGAIDGQMIESIYQAYLSPDELKERWGDNYEENYSKVKEAVKATENEIMVYEDVPIEAVFHSTSAGMTEDAENVWSKEYPYLKSVGSNEDIMSPEYMDEAVFSNAQLLDIFRQSFGGLVLTDAAFTNQFQIISRSSAGYVEEAQLGGITLTGRQIREALGLKSSAFSVDQKGDYVTFTTKGYGHGVGMSQYGANIMAENGSGYRDILARYYTGVSIADISSLHLY